MISGKWYVEWSLENERRARRLEPLGRRRDERWFEARLLCSKNYFKRKIHCVVYTYSGFMELLVIPLGFIQETWGNFRILINYCFLAIYTTEVFPEVSTGGVEVPFFVNGIVNYVTFDPSGIWTLNHLHYNAQHIILSSHTKSKRPVTALCIHLT
jgi:hypothetical protein